MKHIPGEHKNLNSFVYIKLNDRIFGIQSRIVMELSEVPNMTKIPGAPEFLRGIMLFQKQNIPIIDLKLKFLKTRTDFTVNTCLLIVFEMIHKIPFHAALLVDAIQEIKTIGERIDEKKLDQDNHHIDVLLNANDANMLIINLENIFSEDDLGSILSSLAGVTN